MRDFFLKSTSYIMNFTRVKDIDLSRVTRLILVDCQHSSRIGKFAEILGKPDLEVHIYDHHPESSGDITSCRRDHPGMRFFDQHPNATPAGPRAHGQSHRSDLMMLGIYEDTGSLIFPSTTVDDFQAAAWLLERGGNLNTVADFITQELTSEQVSLLNDLLKSLKTTDLNGVDISIAHASLDYYVGDIAVLAHMMRDMENLQALFIVVGMASRVYIVARSRIPEVNVGEILHELGGGGHATAASATVRDLTLIQVLVRLEEVLRAKVNPRRTARDIMSSPVKTMPANDLHCRGPGTADQVQRQRHACDGRREDGGIISRRIVEQALYHNLGEVPVTDYMHTEFLRATPDTPLPEIQQYFIGQEPPVRAGLRRRAT